MHELAQLLRRKADEIELAVAKLTLPVQHIDIPSAFARLRLIMGNDVHLQIRPPSIDSYSVDRELRASAWSVYLGVEAGDAHGEHCGQTLAAAVDAAIAAWRKARNPDEGRADASEVIRDLNDSFDPLPL